MCSRAGRAVRGGGVGVGGVDLRGRTLGPSSPPPMLLFLVLASLLCATGGGVPLKGRGATPPRPDSFRGCVYGGSEYGEGESVVTEESCLNCTCYRGALVCHLRACPALPKAAGCSAVRRGQACCPSIVCDEVNNTVGRAIEEVTFGTESARNATGCDVDGRQFEEGSIVPGIAGHCKECRCTGGKVGCARAPCSPAPAGCTPLFASADECCPSRYDCPPAPSLALLIDIELGSNIESVLAPPSHEELMGYFGANSTEGLQGEEKGSGPPTASPEGTPAAQSASAATGQRVLVGGGDYLRKDRHMETSTLEEKEGGGGAGGQKKSAEAAAVGGSADVEAAANGSSAEGAGTEGTAGAEETSTEEATGTATEEEEAAGSTEGEEATTTLEPTTTVAAPDAPEATEETPATTEEAEVTTAEVEGEVEAETTTRTESTFDSDPSTEEPTTDGWAEGEGTNETVAYSAAEEEEEGNTTAAAVGGEEEAEEVVTESPALFSDDYAAGNETAELDYEQMLNNATGDNSTEDAALDSSKNVSGVVLGGGEGEGAVNASSAGGAAGEEKTMDKMILALPVNCSDVDLPPPITTASIERKKDSEDYEEFDYGEPTLPPSLPNLRIIPFVAADAVLDKDKHKTTEAPIFFDGVPPSLFSPPVETEGGFVPRDPPILDGGLHDVTYKSPILSDNLPSFQTDIPPTGIAAIELTTTSKPNVQGDYGLQSLVVNGTLGSSVLDSLFSPLDQLPPEKGVHTLLSPIVRPSFLDSKITPLKPMPGTLTFYNNASHYPPLPTTVPGSPSKSQTVPVTYSPLPTKIPNYNTFPSSSHKGTAASPFSAMRNTAKRPSTMGVTPTTTTSKNVLATMTSSASGGSPSGGQRRPLPSSDRVSVIPLGPTPPRPSPSTSAPYSVGPNLPPSMKPLTSPPVTSTSPGSSLPVPQNPSAVGLLKLAGCNIYGRMYRVGRIISELSGPCLECRCTEVGVQCRPLPC